MFRQKCFAQYPLENLPQVIFLKINFDVYLPYYAYIVLIFWTPS